jgi:hypothetical protein
MLHLLGKKMSFGSLVDQELDTTYEGIAEEHAR